MYARRFVDAPTAEALALCFATRTAPVWLDGEGRGPQGRWSFLSCEPVEVEELAFGAADALDRVGALADAQARRGDALEGAPFSAADVPSWIGYLAYDLAWSAPPPKRTVRLARPAALPIAWFGRYAACVAVDHASGQSWLVGDDRAACDELEAIGRSAASAATSSARVGPVQVDDRALHRRAIERALEHILRGNIYQVNLARRWTAPFDGAPFALARAMRHASPVPFGFFLDRGDHALVVRTMERFLRWERAKGALSTRPIKGTLARDGRRDAADAATLRADEKERAEHVMIVDLMRNDLGRVARYGSVHVPELMAVEPYARLSHLVSTVTATTRDDVGGAQVLRATFPPGSVTGAPKVRAMELIEELEPVCRGVYTGAVGFVDRAGGLSLAVAIRAAHVLGGELWYHAGGGIVEASDPEREVQETELKARVLFDALDELGGR